MKKHTFRLSIDEPCLENWADMSQTEQGAFCAVCQKEVIDFSDKTSSEIAAFFSQKKEKTCGRFLKSQLEETYVIYPPYRKSKFKYAAGLALGLLFTNSSSAKNKLTNFEKIQVVSCHTQVQDSLIETKSKKDFYTISGYVVDENGEALVGVNVTLFNSTMGTVSDINGKFTLTIDLVPAIFCFSFGGYQTKYIKLSQAYKNYSNIISGKINLEIDNSFFDTDFGIVSNY